MLLENISNQLKESELHLAMVLMKSSLEIFNFFINFELLLILCNTKDISCDLCEVKTKQLL